ncbi:hypothetical protein BJX96DRAFT_187274 [Aspergillus floccosus]
MQKRRKPRQAVAGSRTRRRYHPFNQLHATSSNLQQSISDTLGAVVAEDGSATEDVTQTIMPGNEMRKGELQRNSQRNILDLAFVLHPSHQVATFKQAQKQSPSPSDGPVGLARQACSALGISQDTMNQMIQIFFDNMVAINIFHQPSFAEKLSKISSCSELTALLAAMAGYASRFAAPTINGLGSDTVQPGETHDRPPEYFLDLAFTYINKSLMDYDDDVPPLCVIQALIVATHCRLTQGVRGKAWRCLGLCVSLVYESNLHCLDSRRDLEVKDVLQWQEDEEKRRAFWAVWEMDVFASTIRRTPTAIDWDHMEGNQRWKVLQESGNLSPKAWYLVINSLMKEAQIIRDMQAVSPMDNNDNHHRKPKQYSSRSASPIEGCSELETLANAVYCFNMALPSHLQYRDQYLAFGAPTQGQTESQRQQHCSVYDIYVMTQLAYLMIYRNDAFILQSCRPGTNRGQPVGNQAHRTAFRWSDTENGALQYFGAADRILRIVNQSCVEHIQCINPFLSNTIWLAAAVQLVRKYFTGAHSNQSLIRSRFDILHLTYKRCMEFWDMQNALQRNLEIIREQLEVTHKKRENQVCSCSQEASRRTSKNTGLINQICSDWDSLHIARDATSAQSLRQPTQYLPETPNVVLSSSTYIPAELEITGRNGAPQYLGPDAMGIFDAMASLHPSGSQTSETSVGATDSNLLDPIYQLDQAFDWPTFDFSGRLQGLFAWRNA